MYTVYKHTAPNGKVYIGITKQRPERRWGKGGRGYKENDYFYRAIQKYGWDNFKHEIIAENLTEEEAGLMEIDLISQHRSVDRSCGYNRHAGGVIHDTVSHEDFLKYDMLPYEVIKASDDLRDVFDGLLKAALGFKWAEKIEVYRQTDGEPVLVETRITEREQKPSYLAICILLEHYCDSEQVQPIKALLLKLKREIEED